MSTILDILIALIAGSIALTIVVSLHEFGHYYMAKRAGIYCKEFSIGMGPIIWQTKKGETFWSIRALPIGGYVDMAGEYGEASEDDEDSDIPSDRYFTEKTVFERFLVAVAGVTMNVALGLFVYIVAGLIAGVPNYESNQIFSVNSGTPAYEAGLRDGDYITYIEGEEISTFTDISLILDNLVTDENGKNTIEITYERSGTEYTTTLNPMYIMYNLMVVSDIDEPDNLIVSSSAKIGNLDFLQVGDEIIEVSDSEGILVAVSTWNEVINLTKGLDGKSVKFTVLRDGEEEEVIYSETYDNELLTKQSIDVVSDLRIGISPDTHFSLFGGIKNGFIATKDAALLIFNTLDLLLFHSQVGVSDLGGPVAIFQMSGSFIKSGLTSFLGFIGLLSINVAVLNLIPIPALDGGRIMFLGYEAIFKKKPDPKVESIMINATFLLLLLFFVVVFFNDILRLFS